MSEVSDLAQQAELAIRRLDHAQDRFCDEVRASRIPNTRIKVSLNRTKGVRFIRWKIDYRNVAGPGRLLAGRYGKGEADAPAHVLKYLLRMVPASFHDQMVAFEERRLMLNRCRAAAYFAREYLQRALAERAQVHKLRRRPSE